MSDKNKLAVHCLHCGKNFYCDTPAICGGTSNDKPMCNAKALENELGARLKRTAEDKT